MSAEVEEEEEKEEAKWAEKVKTQLTIRSAFTAVAALSRQPFETLICIQLTILLEN